MEHRQQNTGTGSGYNILFACCTMGVSIDNFLASNNDSMGHICLFFFLGRKTAQILPANKWLVFCKKPCFVPSYVCVYFMAIYKLHGSDLESHKLDFLGFFVAIGKYFDFILPKSDYLRIRNLYYWQRTHVYCTLYWFRFNLG